MKQLHRETYAVTYAMDGRYDAAMTKLPPDQWIPRFADTLLERQPALKPSTAISIAATQYEEASDLDPAEAAEIYALEEPPGDVGAPE